MAMLRNKQRQELTLIIIFFSHEFLHMRSVEIMWMLDIWTACFYISLGRIAISNTNQSCISVVISLELKNGCFTAASKGLQTLGL